MYGVEVIAGQQW